MATAPKDETEQGFLSDAARLRRIAFAVLRDEARADDVLQEAWLMTQTCRPSEFEDERAWLRGVVRNLALNARREERRRERRERAAASAERLEDAAEIAARRSVLEFLAEGVQALEEPVRTPVKLRYLEGLETRQVAERLRRPVPTVKDQVRRGLEQLRARMTAEFGESRAWSLGLIAAFDWSPAELRAALGTATRGGLSSLWVPWASVAGIALVSLGIWTTWGSGDGRVEGSAAGLAAVEGEPGAPRAEAAPRERRSRADLVQRDLAGDPSAAPAEGAPDAGPPFSSLEITVTDGHGAPVAGAAIRLSPPIDVSEPAEVAAMATLPETELSRTDVRGRAVIDVREDWIGPIWGGADGVVVSCVAEGYASLWNYRVPIQKGTPAPVEIALEHSACSLEIRVVDHEGEPVERSGLILSDARTAVATFEERGVRREGARRMIAVAERSVFESDHLRPGPHELVTFVPEVGLAWRHVECGVQGTIEVPVGPPRRVHGRVLDTDGEPVPGAPVWLTIQGVLYIPPEWSRVTSDADGRYELWVGDQPRVKVSARHPGVPGLISEAFAILSPGVDEELDLHFEKREQVRVRLVDTEGRPLARWLARPLDRARYEAASVTTITDADGRLVFRVLEAAPITVGVAGQVPIDGFSRWLFPGLTPGDEEHILVVDTTVEASGVVLGELRADDWDAPCDLVMRVCQNYDGRSLILELPCPGEVFALEDLPQGEVHLTIEGPDALRLPLGFHRIPAGDFVDLGSIELPPPTRTTLVAAGGEGTAAAVSQSAILSGAQFCKEVCHLQAGWISGPIDLLPGTYELYLWDSPDSFVVRGLEVPRASEAVLTVVR